MLTRSVLNQKKGEYLANKMSEYGSDIMKLAAKEHLTLELDKALVFSARSFGVYGRELKATGTAFGLEPGSVSKPVIDRTAVFVIKLNGITESDAERGFVQASSKLQKDFASSINNNLPYRAIEKAAEIEDNRIKFF